MKAAETLAMIDIESSSLDISLDTLEYYDGSLSGNKVYLTFFKIINPNLLSLMHKSKGRQVTCRLLSLEQFFFTYHVLRNSFSIKLKIIKEK